MFNSKRRKTAKAFFSPANVAELNINGLPLGDKLNLAEYNVILEKEPIDNKLLEIVEEV